MKKILLIILLIISSVSFSSGQYVTLWLKGNPSSGSFPGTLICGYGETEIIAPKPVLVTITVYNSSCPMYINYYPESNTWSR